jgi:hypothetical protein
MKSTKEVGIQRNLMGGGSGGQDFTIGITNLAVLYSTQWVYK